MQKMKYRIIGTFDQDGICRKTEILKFNDVDEYDPKSDESVLLEDGTSLMCIGEITSTNGSSAGSILRMKLNDNVRISVNRDTELEKLEEPVTTPPEPERLDPSLMVKITQPAIHGSVLGSLDDPISNINRIGLWALAKSRLLKFNVDLKTLSDFITCMNTVSDPDMYIPVVSDTMHWQEIYNAITYRSELVSCVLYGEGVSTKSLNRMIIYVDRVRYNEPSSQIFRDAAQCFHRLLSEYHYWPTPMEEGSKVLKVKILLN